jgi:hypothetical protein
MSSDKLGQKSIQKIIRIEDHGVAKTPSERLTFLRQVLRLSREELLGEYAIPKTSLLTWEHGSKNISDQNLHRLLDIYLQEGLAVTLEWVRTGEGEAPHWTSGAAFSRAIKLGAVEKSGKKPVKLKSERPVPVLVTDDFLFAQEAMYFRNLSDQSIAVLLKSDDMAPRFYRGDMVAGRFRWGEDLYDLVNKDCIVRTVDGKEYVRTLVKCTEKKKDQKGAVLFDLICANPSAAYDVPAVMTAVPVEMAAPIIWIRRREPK